MIIEALIYIVSMLFEAIISTVRLPKMPEQMQYYLIEVFDYIDSGLSVVSIFFDLEYLFVLLQVVLLVDIGLMTYRFFVWFIKKIPFLGVK